MEDHARPEGHLGPLQGREPVLLTLLLGLLRLTTWAPALLSSSEGLNIPKRKGRHPAHQRLGLAASRWEQKGANQQPQPGPLTGF